MEQLVTSTLLSMPLIGAYAINAIGIVVVYRASNVLNLAHGAMTMLAAYAAFQVVDWGLPRPIGLLGGVGFSVALALAVERFFVRRLRAGGPTAQTIGTVAAFGVMVALASRLWGTTPRQSVAVFPEQGFRVFGSVINYGQIGLFVSMLVVASLLFLLLQRTYLGLVLRGTAENRLAASLMGADPDRMTQLAWAIGGAMAALAGEMLAAVGSLHPFNLAFAALPAYVAALLGGMQSLPGAVAGAAVVGLVQSWAPLLGPVGDLEGNGQLVVAVIALAVMASRGARITGGDAGGALDAGSGAGAGTTRKLNRALVAAGIVAMLLFPHLPFVSFSLLGNMNEAAIFAMVAVSLVLLTGWVGQISLAHATFVGIGAFVTGIVLNRFGLPFPLNLPIAAAAAAGAAAILGTVALRVRGLYLAVATLIFAWMGERFLFRQDWLTSDASIFPEPLGRGGGLFPTVDASDRTHFFYIAWATVLLVVFLAANLRDTKTGRAFFAVRGSEVAASSLGVDVTRYKLLAFVISGAIAGLAGGFVMIMQRSVVADQFAITESLFFLAVLVVGGIMSLPGAVSAALLFGGIQEMFFRYEALSEYVELASAVLLAAVLLLYRRGLAGVPDSFAVLWRRLEPTRERLAPRMGPIARTLERGERAIGRAAEAIRGVRNSAKRSTDGATPIPEDVEPVEAHVAGRVDLSKLPKNRKKRNPLLEAEDITVVFGGLTAANEVNLTVYEGEIVGLIGPNGAGKTTTFNAIAGLNQPTRGHVRLFGEDVTTLPVHKRAAYGVGRTFQLIQLFPQLTVFDNLLVATHLANDSGVLSGAMAGTKSLIAESLARARVREVVHILGLDDVVGRPVAGLPFGVLRMVEVGRAMVTDPKLIMLDEPASGLDNSETDKLSELLLSVRDLGVGLLLIEHDVRMVTSVSDYMYVIDRGTPLADGTPEQIQRNPDVIAAYLGRSIEDEKKERKSTSGKKRPSAISAQAPS